MSFRHSFPCLLLLLLISAPIATARDAGPTSALQTAGYTVVDLGAGKNLMSSIGMAINASGQIAGYIIAGSDQHAVRWDPIRESSIKTIPPAGSCDPSIFAVNSAERWAVSTSTTEYVGGPESIVALDHASGSRRWIIETEWSSEAGLVANDLLIVRAVEAATEFLVAFDTADGTERWRLTVIDGLSVERISSLASEGDQVFVQFSSPDDDAELIAALDAATGKAIWVEPVHRLLDADYAYDLHATAVTLMPGVPLLFLEASVLVLDSYPATVSGIASIQDGYPVWISPYTVNTTCLLASRSTLVTLVSPVPYGMWFKSVMAINAGTGAAMWQRTFKDDISYVALNGDLLIVSTTSGEMSAIDLANGKRRWTTPIAADPASIAAGDGAIVVVDGAGNLTALSGETGDVLWDLTVSLPVWSISTGENIVIVAGRDRVTIAAFDTESGELIWETSP